MNEEEYWKWVADCAGLCSRIVEYPKLIQYYGQTLITYCRHASQCLEHCNNFDNQCIKTMLNAFEDILKRYEYR